MPRYEYKVIPAPKKPGKVKGVRGTDQKFAASLATIMNDLGQDGWEYQRTDTLPCEERQGLTGRTTTFQNMLVFRREIKDLADVAPRPAAAQAAPAPAAEMTPLDAPAPVAARPTVPPAARPFMPEPVAEPAPEPAVATFVRDRQARREVGTPAVAEDTPAVAPQSSDPARSPDPSTVVQTVPSFRSASANPTPRLSAVSEVPEGKAPSIRFRPADNIAAQ